MEIINVNEKQHVEAPPLTLAIGNFDGVHKGHQVILQKAREQRKDGETLAVMGFADHPLRVLKNDQEFDKKITPEQEKLHLLERFGVERYYRLKIMKDDIKTTFWEFVFKQLSKLKVNRIVIGEDTDYDEASHTEFLNVCDRQGIEVTVVPKVKVNGTNISSRTIRDYIKEGLMDPVHALLGRPFKVTGTVVHGEKMGRKLGFPTLNLGEVDSYVVPKPGVYLGIVGIHKNGVISEYWNTLISAGYRPAVNGQRYLIEAHLLNFSGDLYGKTVSVSFLRFMREELNFDNLDALVEQMEQDKIEGQNLMGSSS
ncbi:riboflavin biosynthesis protein RibF [Virgibacillus sp. MSP4-1]|uniref:riboflavin biosynthesis protein RibF n=1 Tax=Virgibacillus sp. MSP4-1 TaxID=2700081 RepID=UPI00039E172F|nr:riboflavin biosynthesis protein RibF [Virgibacillus sp. MSP4-1]QHS21491.1 riboflavin biosynthesis protein RibF [Virgibacillus sp. MSP4-1]